MATKLALTEQPEPEQRTVHEAVCAIIRDLPGLGKDAFNEQQKFKFRSIDAMMNALGPLLAKHGVHFAPAVTHRDTAERTTRNGGTLYVVSLLVEFTFYGPTGDSFTASGWGEGTDSGDKATNKAMTGAMKYVLTQVFAVRTEDQHDADAETPEETVTPERTPKQRAWNAALHICDGVKDDALNYMTEIKLKLTGGEDRELTDDELGTAVAELEAVATRKDAE